VISAIRGGSSQDLSLVAPELGEEFRATALQAADVRLNPASCRTCRKAPYFGNIVPTSRKALLSSSEDQSSKRDHSPELPMLHVECMTVSTNLPRVVAEKESEIVALRSGPLLN